MIEHHSADDKVRVLIVDDDPAAARLLGVLIDFEDDLNFVGMLSRQEKLLDTIQELDVDVVLLDLFMPGEDSIQSVRSLRDAGLNVQVILYTGWPGDTLLEEAIRAGAAACISKTVEPAELFRAIRKAAHPAAMPEAAAQTKHVFNSRTS